MKKIFAFIFVCLCAYLCVACKKPTETKEPTPVETNEPTEKGEGVMTYAEYMAAPIDSKVTIEGYIQDATYYNPTYANITLYLADQDGAYYVYRAPADAELAAKLVKGAKVKVEGTKAEWAGEVEIGEGTGIITVLEGESSYNAPLKELELNNPKLKDYNNQYVKFNNLIIEGQDGAAFLYKWNGAGSHDENSDLYYNVNYLGQVYSFVVESDLRDNTSDVYAAVEGLKVGDIVDVEGYLYWYETVQLHTTKVTVKGNINDKQEGTLSYEEYAALPDSSDNVTIEGYIQDMQVYNPTYANVTLYLADGNGAYFVYRAPADQTLYDSLSIGQKIKVTGTKGIWCGEEEIAEGTGVVSVCSNEEKYIALPKKIEAGDVATYSEYQNQLVIVRGTIVASNDDGAAFLYKYNGSGSHEENSDLYFNVNIGGVIYSFVVESDLRDNTTDIYAAVEALRVDEYVEITGYLYCYETAQMHVVGIKEIEIKK